MGREMSQHGPSCAPENGGNLVAGQDSTEVPASCILPETIPGLTRILWEMTQLYSRKQRTGGPS